MDIRKHAVNAIAHVLRSAEIGLSIGDPRVDVDDTAGAVIVRLPGWSDEDPEIVEDTRQAAMGWIPFGVKLEIDTTRERPCVTNSLDLAIGAAYGE
jgi:hypothetical protein